MGKTAVVIGATGLIGKSLVNQLAAMPSIDRVDALTRTEYDFKSSKVINHVIDFENLHKYKNLFQGDYLFSCLGTTLKQAKSIQAQRTIDVDYQLQAAELAAENGIAHYLLVSSSGANSESNSPYLEMKGFLENKVKALPFQKTSIFQPSLLLGERPTTRFAETLGAIILPTLCNIPGLQKYRPIKGELVAKKMLQVSQKQCEAFRCYTLSEVFPD